MSFANHPICRHFIFIDFTFNSSLIFKNMSFLKSKTVSFIYRTVILVLLVSLFIALILFPLYVGLVYGKTPTETEYWIQYISVFLSSFSFAAVIITLWKQHKDEKQQQEQIRKNFEFAQHNYDSQILDKIHFFTSDSMAKCRGGACRLWFQLDSDSAIKEKVLEYLIMTITNKEEEKGNIDEDDFYKDICAFFKLIRYFNIMSFYSYNNITANAVHFYYVYYRRFFKEMIEIYNEACDSIEENQQVKLVRENWIYLVKKMDDIMIKNNLPLE